MLVGLQMATNLRFSTVVTIAAVLVAPIFACAVTAQAQGTPPPTTPAVTPPPRLKLTAEQEYIIREIVFKDISVQKENSAPETVGDSVPENIKLYPLPPEVIQKVPQARSHMFFIKDDEIVIVSSSDRRIADVIKKNRRIEDRTSHSLEVTAALIRALRL
jgi:hypothetical protein